MSRETTHEFFHSSTDEPHRSRRDQMLSEDYSDKIKELYGPDPKNFYIISAMVVFQLIFAVYLAVNDVSWFWIVVFSYALGGTINHSLTLGIHELSHNLVFKDPSHNFYLGLFASLPHAVPTFVTFRKYHLIHHRYQGVDDIDPDMPTAMEGEFFTTPIRKFIFLFMQPFFYSFRPMLLYPGDITKPEIIGYAVAGVFDFMLLQYVGAKALAYLFLSLVLGSGLHPLAAHFIAEHYVWSDKKDKNGDVFETYSYYGPLNNLTFNVGYHNEHHDFPRIPGSRLHKLHDIAPEYYKEVKENAHKSWVGAMWRFVVDPTINPFSRVTRSRSR